MVSWFLFILHLSFWLVGTTNYHLLECRLKRKYRLYTVAIQIWINSITYLHWKILALPGFEPGTSLVGANPYATNWAILAWKPFYKGCHTRLLVRAVWSSNLGFAQDDLLLSGSGWMGLECAEASWTDWNNFKASPFLSGSLKSIWSSCMALKIDQN